MRYKIQPEKNNYLSQRFVDAGYCPSYVALPPGPWARVLDFFIHRFPRVPAWVWLHRLAQGWVWDARQGLVIANEALYAPLQGRYGGLYYERIRPAIEPIEDIEMPLNVLAEDDFLVVVDKPAGVTVAPVGIYGQRSLLMQLRQQGQSRWSQINPVHRLDKDTSGLVLFVKKPIHRARYHTLFEKRQVHKRYWAVAPSQSQKAPTLMFPCERQSRLVPDPFHFFRSIEIPGPANSHTRIARLASQGDWALYELRPVTGQRHQLRVHMNALGLPIRGDVLYPTVRESEPEPVQENETAQHVSSLSSLPSLPSLPSLQLLAKELAFLDPLDGQEKRWVSRQQLNWPIPPGKADLNEDVPQSGPAPGAG
jgi:tRNA pseudouridine32 synthase/23S rRNA pseudouridine746 synthase